MSDRLIKFTREAFTGARNTSFYLATVRGNDRVAKGRLE
jgi:hypothetical protein